MRVLQVHAQYRTPAGEDTVVLAEAEALTRSGHTVEQIIIANPAGALASMAALARSAHNSTTGRLVGATIDSFSPDIVHVHNTWFAVSASAFTAAADRRVPTVMTLHNYRLGCVGSDLFRDGDVCTACIGRSPRHGVVHGCYRGSRVLSAVHAVEIMSTRRRRLLDRHVTTFIAPSAFMADRMIDIGVPEDRLVVKPHFTADPGPRFTSPATSNQVVFVGRLAPGKGIEALLRTWPHSKRCTTDGRPLELVVIGDGPLSSTLRASPPAGVRFVGWQSHADVMRSLLGARALVFPSQWYEPFGMVLIEAMSAGLPIVTSNASGAAQITGSPPDLVVSSRSDGDMVHALDRLCSDDIDAVGLTARRRYDTHYSEPIGVGALEAVYQGAIRRHGCSGRDNGSS